MRSSSFGVLSTTPACRISNLLSAYRAQAQSLLHSNVTYHFAWLQGIKEVSTLDDSNPLCEFTKSIEPMKNSHYPTKYPALRIAFRF